MLCETGSFLYRLRVYHAGFTLQKIKKAPISQSFFDFLFMYFWLYFFFVLFFFVVVFFFAAAFLGRAFASTTFSSLAG